MAYLSEESRFLYTFLYEILRELRKLNGEGEIRTPVTLAGQPVFETGAFNRSATSPGAAKKGSFWRRANYSRHGAAGKWG